jgi:SAM-dependent methyltransferase
VSAEDRARWDRRYTASDGDAATAVGLPALFRPFADHFPTAGCALDIACGRGSGALWLARRGMQVRGYDVSAAAIAQASAAAQAGGLAERCGFVVADLDAGLPPGPSAAVVLCSMFRDPRLDAAIVARLGSGGVLAISALSERSAGPGRFRVPPDEFLAPFAALEVIAAGDAWLLARKR